MPVAVILILTMLILAFATVDAGFFLYPQHSAGAADHHGGAKHRRDPEFFVLSYHHSLCHHVAPWAKCCFN